MPNPPNRETRAANSPGAFITLKQSTEPVLCLSTTFNTRTNNALKNFWNESGRRLNPAWMLIRVPVNIGIGRVAFTVRGRGVNTVAKWNKLRKNGETVGIDHTHNAFERANTMKTNRITFKKLKMCNGHDGAKAWSADFYLDGERMGDAADDAWGGPLMITFIGADQEQTFDSHCSTLPGLFIDETKTIPCDAELAIGRAMEDHLERKQLVRWCKTKIVFNTPGDPAGVYHQYIVKRRGDSPERVAATIKQVMRQIAADHKSFSFVNNTVGVWP